METEFLIRTFNQQLFFRTEKRHPLADILPGIQGSQTQVILEMA